MRIRHDLIIDGIPSNVSEELAAIYRSRCLMHTNEFFDKAGLSKAVITIGPREVLAQQQTPEGLPASPAFAPGSPDEMPIEVRAQQYRSGTPLFDFDHLVVPDEVREELLAAIDLERVEKIVFEQWGLKEIEPFPRTSLNFHGEPGTGKTLAAHAVAHRLNRPILIASYAEIESKFHGDGPKNVQAIFYAAERDHAILFIDEADSLLSKRLTEVNQGSEQAINSMRSQLFICLEQFRGIVIFATNLVENYDKAFETRVRHIHFSLPDEQARADIWSRHLVAQLPRSSDVSPAILASEFDGLCGRDIKNAVINAAVNAARCGQQMIFMQDLRVAIERIKQAREEVEARRKRLAESLGEPLTEEEKQKLSEQIRLTRSPTQPDESDPNSS